jgi:hypothetical protein
MKKTVNSVLSVLLFIVAGLFLINLSVTGQEAPKELAVLPDSISAIVNISCVPCHTNNGGLISRSKLNFSEWTRYSPKKQKERAEKMYEELNKSAMPPKSARQTRPEIIPSREQIEKIKKWADSLKPDDK